MAYSAKVIALARERLEQENADKKQLYNTRREQVYAALPEVRQLDQQMHLNMTQAAQAVLGKDADVVGVISAARQQNTCLQQKRDGLVAEAFGENYLQEPLCPHCGGVGYVGTAMCQCLQELCRLEQMEQISSLGCGSGNFSDFRLDYYSERIDPKLGISPREVMEQNVKLCRKFAKPFAGGNMLFVGGTGLGKTFLSACVATQVALQGYSVAYESAGHLFYKLERERFSPDEEILQQVKTLRECDLLIVDDLGTEMPGNFVTAALYTLVNDRLLSGKSTVISTNLTVDEIAQRYNPQIASRLQGNYRLLPFIGDDIRILKNRRK